MTELLSDSDIERRLDASQWAREGDEVVRGWTFNGLTEADFKLGKRFDGLGRAPRSRQEESRKGAERAATFATCRSR